MRTILCTLVFLSAGMTARAADTTYEGTWNTTNRKLDGTMTCVVTDLGNEKWRGHFYGVWYGQEFSYKVDFTGPPEKLRGKANIDGADYDWTGKIDKDTFSATFGGNRYVGSFYLKKKGK